MPLGEFYFAGTTGQGFTDDGPNRTVLSWAHFLADETGLHLLNSATAHGAATLTIGTLTATAIPEPASAATLLGCAVLAAGLGRRRANSRKQG
jgi:hypothetical protein